MSETSDPDSLDDVGVRQPERVGRESLFETNQVADIENYAEEIDSQDSEKSPSLKDIDIGTTNRQLQALDKPYIIPSEIPHHRESAPQELPQYSEIIERTARLGSQMKSVELRLAIIEDHLAWLSQALDIPLILPPVGSKRQRSPSFS